MGDSPRSFSRSNSLGAAKGKAWVKPPTTAATVKLDRTNPRLGLDCFDLLQGGGDDIWQALDNIAVFRLSLEHDNEASRLSRGSSGLSVYRGDKGRIGEPEELEEDISMPTAKSLNKWMKHLHRRAQRPSIPDGFMDQYPEFWNAEDPMRINSHRKSSSGSSFGFVAAVKSATVSLASASVRTRQGKKATRSSIRTRTDHSSRGSFSTQRMSEDSMYFERNSRPDPGVTDRLLRRQRILEELITTEESYISDLKFLTNVCLISLLHCRTY
jgi:hypothetical protein